MDSLITAAARALAAGDPLGALNRVALRDDAPALALRGIAMAQLGEFVRAKALVRRAARAFSPNEALARARCVVAEAEIALASRELGWPEKALDAARATLEAHGDSVNAAHARYLAIRRLLLIGRVDEAARTLAALDAATHPPALRAAHELIVAVSRCGASRRSPHARPSPAPSARRATRAFPRSRPKSSARFAFSTRPPRASSHAAKRARCGSMRSRPGAHRRRSSSTRAAASCTTRARRFRSRAAPCCSRLHARSARPGPATRRARRSSPARFA